MDSDYKLEEFPKNTVLRIAGIESIPNEYKKNSDKKTIASISSEIPKIYIQGDYETILRTLGNILSYSNKHFFEDLQFDDIRQTFDFAMNKFSNKKPEESEEEEEHEEKYQAIRSEITKISRQILIQFVQQPEVADMFISEKIGGLYEISQYWFNSKWALKCLTNIATISPANRNTIFNFGFYYNLLNSISYKPMPIIDFEVSCQFAGSLVEHKTSDPYQNQCAKEIFPILYELEKSYIETQPEKGIDFLISAKKLIPHIQWLKSYTEDNEIHNIFPLLPDSRSTNNDQPIFFLIEKNIDVEHDNDKDKLWFEQSAKYIYDWLLYNFFYLPESECIQSIDFDPLWKILFLILKSFFREAKKTASECLTLLIKIDIDNFINQQYYSNIVEEFPESCHEIKLDLLTVISIAFYKSTNEQMNQLIQQPNIFDLIFGTLGSFEYNRDHLFDIILGLHRFIDFCGLSPEGMGIFKDLVIENNDFENWMEQLINYTYQIKDKPKNQDLIDKANELNNLIHQKIDEYEALTQQDQSPEE